MHILGAFPLIRLRQFRDNPGALWHYIMRFVWHKRASERLISRYSGYLFLTPKETLDRILCEDLSLARFNDGELGMLAGFGIYPPDSDWSQRYSKALDLRLQEVLASRNQKLLIAVPPPWVFLATREEAKGRGVLFTMWTEARMLLYRFLRTGQSYGDANVFIPFHHKDFDWERFHGYLSHKDVVIITGGISRLFDVSLGRRTFFVEAGKRNAFERYAEIRMRLAELIEAEGLRKEDTLLMASLGTTADVLALDLTEEGWQVWDTGHFFRYADRQSFSGSRKDFTKQLTGRTPEEVSRSFEKASAFYEAAQHVRGLVFPKPLFHTATTIVFERLSLPALFSDVLREGRWNEDDFLRIGRAIGGLHQKLPLGIGGHGDLWAHNIAIDDSAVYLFDADPPSLSPSSEAAEDARLMDLAALCVSVSLTGSFKRPWQFLGNRNPYLRALLRGYEEAGERIDIESLSHAMEAELLRWRRWQEAFGYTSSAVSVRHWIARVAVWRQMHSFKLHG